MHNPCIRGWIGHYGYFYKTQLHPTLLNIRSRVNREVHARFWERPGGETPPGDSTNPGMKSTRSTRLMNHT
jgi:hypothetical protein